MEPLGGGVDAEAQPRDEHDGAQESQRHGDRPHRVVGGHAVAVGGGGPVTLPDEQDVQVEEETGDRREIEQRSERDHAAAELVEVVDRRDGLHRPGEPRAEAAEEEVGQHQHPRRHRPQDERHRGDGGEQRRGHSGRRERRAEQRVADVVGEQQAPVGAPEEHQDERVAERERQRRPVDAEHRRVLAEHDLEVGRREGEQQFVGPELLLLGPHRHGERGDEEDQDVGEEPVQLVEVRQVVQEEAVLPERRGGAQQDEQRQEDIAGRVGEVHAEVPPHEGRHHRAPDVRDFDEAGHHATSPEVGAGESGAAPFPAASPAPPGPVSS